MELKVITWSYFKRNFYFSFSSLHGNNIAFKLFSLSFLGGKTERHIAHVTYHHLFLHKNYLILLIWYLPHSFPHSRLWVTIRHCGFLLHTTVSISQHVQNHTTIRQSRNSSDLPLSDTVACYLLIIHNLTFIHNQRNLLVLIILMDYITVETTGKGSSNALKEVSINHSSDCF